MFAVSVQSPAKSGHPSSPCREDLSAALRALGCAAGRPITLPAALAQRLGMHAFACVLERRAGGSPDSQAVHRYMEALANNIPLRRTLEQAAAALSAAGVRAIVYKGQDYLERIYGELGARAMADVDLLVPESELARAERALIDAGFIPDLQCRRTHERKFVKDAVAIDLHHTLLEKARMTIDHAAIFERARPYEAVAGLLALDDDDAFIVHCVNQTVKGFDLPAHSYLELAALLARARPQVALARARRFGAVSALYSSLATLGALGHAQAARLAARVGLPPAKRLLLERTVVPFALHSVTRSAPSRASLLVVKTVLIDDPKAAARFVPEWFRWARPNAPPRPLACESSPPARAAPS